jgi:hypothetical protein
MACQQESEGNQGTAIAATPAEAAKIAISRSILGGEIFCNSTGNCSGSQGECSYTVKGGSINISEEKTPEGILYKAVATSSGACECKPVAGEPSTEILSENRPSPTSDE